MLAQYFYEEKDSGSFVASKKEKIPCKYASRKLRDYQTCQQGVFVGLLNKFCDITITKPPKKATITHQFVKIKTVSFSYDDYIVIEEFLQKRCSDHRVYDLSHGCSEKTASRRFQTNKKTETLHLLLDILSEHGYFFDVNTTKGKKGTMKLQNVEKIFLNGKYLLDIDDIYEYGFQVNDIVCQMIDKKDEFTLKRNDFRIQSIF